ncbi:IS66 family transposase [Chryseobacterium sp. T20]|uniref:IS66 family transposase n=1 Tax=Chryseobacterium sp. T20 TaxID=3395375 RepID=UPI0039BCB450
MDNDNFQKLLELLERESSARIASETARLAENTIFQQTIAELNATIKELNETIGLLQEELRLSKGPKKDSGNSSVPPSKDENRPLRTSSLRASSGKRSGGQKGHQGNTLEMTAIPDQVHHHCPVFCRCCGLSLDVTTAELMARRQVIDIPMIKPSYIEHRVYRSSCRCGQQTTGSFPVGVDAPISYGGQTTALIAYLHTRQYISLARISEFFSSVYGKAISQGTVCGILERFAHKALPAFELIRQAVGDAKVVGADETGMKENGRLSWLWTWQSKFATYINASKNRGFETVKANFPAGFPKAILVHDCWPSHLNTAAVGHQICTAHLLRELLFLEQKYRSPWAVEFSKMIMGAIQLKKTIQLREYQHPIKERSDIEAILDSLLRQKIDPQHIEVLTFQKRILKYRKYLLTFLYHNDVPPDNNSSERAIRNVKVKMKVSGMFKSFKGAQNYAIIRSITDTCNKNKQEILNAFLTIANS